MREPIARVVIDSPLPHLDRPFDYSVPASLADAVALGSRVRVPFAGRLLSAVVVGFDPASGAASLKPLKSVSRVPSFSAEALELARQIASRYGGSLWDVLRLMAPARVASVESQPWHERNRSEVPDSAFARAADAVTEAGLGSIGQGPLVWDAPVGGGQGTPASALVGYALMRIREGGSAILVAPDARAAARLVQVCEEWGLSRWNARSGGHVAVLDSEDGPGPRFGAYLAALHGIAPLVVGTRPAAWQPVPRLRAIVVWDEASTTLADPRAPYPHARTVAAMRSGPETDVLIAGHGLSADAVALVEHGFAGRAPVASRREVLPRVEVIGDERRERDGSGFHWLPTDVWKPLAAAARESVAAVLVPQAGYAKGVACARCGAYAECGECGGDLVAQGARAHLACSRCGTAAPHWHCPQCQSPRWRAVGLGVERLAEQLRAMVPGVAVTASSSGTGIVADGAVTSGIVAATPGALPAVAGGYRHLAIVGARLSIAALGAEASAMRAWLNAVSLVASRAEGGGVSVVGELPGAMRAALVGGDGWTVAHDDYEERREAGLPPHRRSARLDGPREAIDRVREVLDGTETVEVVPDGDGAWLLASRGAMGDAVAEVRRVVVERSQAGAAPLYVRVDAVPGA